MQRNWHETHISLNVKLNLSCRGQAFGECASIGSSPFHASPTALFSGEVSGLLSSHWCRLSDLLLVPTAWKHVNMGHYSRIWSWICPSEQVQTFPQALWRQMSPKETVSPPPPKTQTQNMLKLNNCFCRQNLKDTESWLEHRALLLGTCPASAGVIRVEWQNH